MPRIEIIPSNWEASEEKAQGDGTPTEDVCEGCAAFFDRGESIDESNVSDRLKNEYLGATIGDTEVEHPPYEDDDYRCACCGRKLTNDDE